MGIKGLDESLRRRWRGRGLARKRDEHLALEPPRLRTGRLHMGPLVATMGCEAPVTSAMLVRFCARNSLGFLLDGGKSSPDPVV